MAQVFSNDTTKRSTDNLFVELPENIVLPPLALSGRKDYHEPDIASLAADIFKHGQNTPALCRKNDAGLPVLVYGRRRYLAIKHINEHLVGDGKKFQLQFKYESMTDEQALIAAIAENRFRKDVNPMDHCHNITQLAKRCKLTYEQIAEIYFPEAETEKAKADALRWVRERAVLSQLAPEAAEAVRNDEMKITTATQMAKLPHEEQRKAVAEKTVLAGKARIKVAAVKAHRPAPVHRKKTQVADSKPDKKVVRLLAASESMARAIDRFLEKATKRAEGQLVKAYKTYRKLTGPLARPSRRHVPRRSAA
jgi:ParB-like chromosome segregation protein Spo0J